MAGKRTTAKAHAKRKAYAKSSRNTSLYRDTVSGRSLNSEMAKRSYGAPTTAISTRPIQSDSFSVLGHDRTSGSNLMKATLADGSTFVTWSPQSAGISASPDRRSTIGVEEVLSRATCLLGSEETAVEWLKKPCLWLENRSPLEMVQSGAREDVDRYLEQIEYGVYV